LKRDLEKEGKRFAELEAKQRELVEQANQSKAELHAAALEKKELNSEIQGKTRAAETLQADAAVLKERV
jgi:hypothetical protein